MRRRLVEAETVRHDNMDQKKRKHTCTKAVAISTPVPKCLQKKKIGGGIFIHLTFFAMTGKPAPKILAAKTMTVAVSMDMQPGVD
jgi:hypothetical protein